MAKLVLQLTPAMSSAAIIALTMASSVARIVSLNKGARASFESVSTVVGSADSAPKAPGFAVENSPTTSRADLGSHHVGPALGLGLLYVVFQQQAEAIFGPMGYPKPVFMAYSRAIIGVFMVWLHYGLKSLWVLSSDASR